ncbi:MAG: hypothetical protein FWE23_01350 [Chitinivibrionia bacterium]|nr:hypothetical protein [Chitinivibrionia bacterium]
MKKTNVLATILKLVFLVIFNLLFFVLGGFEHNTSVWMSYGFIHFAYLTLLITPCLTRSGKSKAVFGLSLYAVSVAYFVIQFIVGMVFIYLAPKEYNLALLVQLCTAGVFFIAFISNMIANEHSANAEKKRAPQIAYIKNASAKLKTLLETISDKEAKKRVEKVYDALYSSPVKSYPDLLEKEELIFASVNDLERAVKAAENTECIISLTNSLLSAISERNNLLKTLN